MSVDIEKYKQVLERCNFVWILNLLVSNKLDHQVLERCNFVWILNYSVCVAVWIDRFRAM